MENSKQWKRQLISNNWWSPLPFTCAIPTYTGMHWLQYLPQPWGAGCCYLALQMRKARPVERFSTLSKVRGNTQQFLASQSHPCSFTLLTSVGLSNFCLLVTEKICQTWPLRYFSSEGDNIWTIIHRARWNEYQLTLWAAGSLEE